MITISLCMIVRDEEDVIERCLDSIKDVVDEIIIVDTGSKDKTIELAKKYTDNIYNFKWIDDFGAARNYSFSKATKEYILWLDADDILLYEDKEKLKYLKETLDSSVDSVTMNYQTHFDEFGNPILTFKRNRLVKREKNFQWIGFIHEYLEVFGKTIGSDIKVIHKKLKGSGKRNLEIYQNKLKEEYVFNARDTYYYGKELFYNGMYYEAIYRLEEFMVMDGWVEDKIDALYKIADCYDGIGNYKKARESCLRAFEYSSPRAESCYRLGYFFQKEERYDEAIYWYETATKLKIPENFLGFISIDYWTWRPHLQLCVCYHKINKIQESFEHNELAAKFRPQDSSVINNREFFKSIGIQ